MPIFEANDDREFYEARRVMTRFLTGGKAEVSLPDASTAVLTSGRFGPYPGVISTSTAEYTVDRSRMKSDGRAVVRYVGGGIYKNMKSISLSDLGSGRKFFLCWMPRGSWVQTDLVLMENSEEVGRYHSNLGRREDGLLDYATGVDTLVLIPGIASPIPLLILWIGMLAEFFREYGNE
jgi:hypothetical protein